jgi:hypothetical protein
LAAHIARRFGKFDIFCLRNGRREGLTMDLHFLARQDQTALKRRR